MDSLEKAGCGIPNDATRQATVFAELPIYIPNNGRGHPSCACGFKGNTQNIRKHRINCPLWKRYCYQERHKSDNPPK